MFLLPFFLKSVGNLMFQYIVWNRYTMKFLHRLSPDFIQIWEENFYYLAKVPKCRVSIQIKIVGRSS